jgi:hypothetical protein
MSTWACLTIFKQVLRLGMTTTRSATLFFHRDIIDWAVWPDVESRPMEGMMKRLLVVGCLVLSASLTGQIEHAPTVAQCQADQRLWFSVIERENSSELVPAFDILTQWHHEMRDCEKVDPDNKWTYYNTGAEINAEKITRMVSFLDRHGLWGQFKNEDAAGKR